MKNLIPTLLQALVLVVIIQACTTNAAVRKQEAKGDAIPVSVAAIQRTKVQPEIQVSGQLTTDDETYLSFKTGGVVRSVFVKEGDPIHKGQLLATLDLTEIKAQVGQAQLGFEKAQRDFNRVSKLHKDSVATLEQFQNAKTGLDIAQKQLEAAEFNLNFSEIRALANGFVLRKFVSEGQVITSGSAVLLTNGARQNHWILRAGVGDREWSSLAIGDRAKIVVEASAGQEFTATLTHKSEGTDAATGSFSVELTIDPGRSNRFAAGMFAKATIVPSKTIDTWTIPFDALLDGNETEGYVFVTDDNVTARKATVTISGIVKDKVLVTAGLEKAKALIVSGSAYLTDGSAIRIQ